MPAAQATDDDEMLEELRREVREELIAKAEAASVDVVPKDTKDYLRGVEEGARIIIEALKKG